MTIWTLLDQAASRFPERPAVVDGVCRLTYHELRDRACAIAIHLRQIGVRSGDRVALLDVNTWCYLASYFAAAGLGAVLVPLNHRLTTGETEAILVDAGVTVVLHSRGFAPLVAEMGQGLPSIVTVLFDDVDLEVLALGFVPAVVAPNDVAHLYYTSGTTGRAKGVMLTHDNVGRHAQAAVEELTLTAEDRWGHIAPMFHLADAWACFALTQVGGTHIFQARFSPEATLDLIARERVTVTNVVPTMLNLMVRHDDVARHDTSSLRLVLSGGAPIARAVVEAVMAAFQCEYVQTYGLTETSPFLTMSLLGPQLRTLPWSEQIRYRSRTGRPFKTVEVQVVDDLGMPVPADDRTVGEIRARGSTVSPGYWQRPDETRTAFRDGWFYTGDLAVVDGSGYLDIVDRKKDMILTGGETVYSVEVEHALYGHPAVLECAVFATPDPVWGEAVTAAVVPRSGQVADAEELRKFLKGSIAGYKVPRRIEFLPELPRTGSGKITKRLLRERFRLG